MEGGGFLVKLDYDDIIMNTYSEVIILMTSPKPNLTLLTL